MGDEESRMLSLAELGLAELSGIVTGAIGGLGFENRQDFGEGFRVV